MAELPTSDLNSQLIASGLNTSNPENTYVDFATRLSRNAQEQAAQEQAIARAVELTKQSKIQTSNEEEAQAAGANPLLEDSMTPAEAVAYLKIVLKEKGLAEDDALIDEWAKTLPKRVNRQIVEAFASRFARETTRAGQAAMFEATDDIQIPKGKSATDLGLSDMKDASGMSVDDKTVSDGTFTAHVPTEGMYQVIYDNQGNIQKFIPGGKEAADPSIKVGQKEAQFDAKRWSTLENSLENVVKSSRGNQLSSAVFRADRAINEISDTSKSLAPQIVSFIGKDLSGIFQGGVPPVSGMEKEEFNTAFDSLNRAVQKYTGFTTAFRSDTGDRREVLTKLIVRLRDSTLDILEKMLESKVEGFRDIIDKDPDRWNRLLNDKLSAVKAGLTDQSKAATDANTEFPGQKYDKTAAPQVKPKATTKVPKYTVEN